MQGVGEPVPSAGSARPRPPQSAPAPAPGAPTHLDHQLRPLARHRARDAGARHPAPLRVGDRLQPAVVLPLACRRGWGQGLIRGACSRPIPRRPAAARRLAALAASVSLPPQRPHPTRRGSPRYLRPSAKRHTPRPCRLSARQSPAVRKRRRSRRRLSGRLRARAEQPNAAPPARCSNPTQAPRRLRPPWYLSPLANRQVPWPCRMSFAHSPARRGSQSRQRPVSQAAEARGGRPQQAAAAGGSRGGSRSPERRNCDSVCAAPTHRRTWCRLRRRTGRGRGACQP